MSKIKKIQNVNVAGKKVLVRADFNVSLNEHKKAKSTYKIKAVKDTVDFLLENGVSHIALLTHFGRPEKFQDKQKFSTQQLVSDVREVLGVDIEFVSDCIGNEVQNALEGFGDGKIVLLENVRFYKEEKTNSKSFAAQLSQPFDLYINDAFGVSHRKHASVNAITLCIPSYAGLWLQKELKYLEYIKINPKHPAVAIIGGAKIDTKIPMIEMFAKKYEHVLVGGKTAVEAKEREIKFKDNVELPVDFEQKFLDIGPETIKKFCDKISLAKTIVWNGPMGLIEEEQYKKGTLSLIKAIAKNKSAFSLIGGGESVQITEEAGFCDEISFISTGGGAMLAFLGGDKMPGIEVLMIK